MNSVKFTGLFFVLMLWLSSCQNIRREETQGIDNARGSVSLLAATLQKETWFTVAYSQIYLGDYSRLFEPPEDFWTGEELRTMLCARKDKYAVIGTVSSLKVPFHIALLNDKPEIDLNAWDHVNTCSIAIEEGIKITGDFDDEVETLNVDVPPGMYGLLICYRGLGTVNWNGTESKDSYHVFMWQTTKSIPTQVLKQWEGGSDSLAKKARPSVKD